MGLQKTIDFKDIEVVDAYIKINKVQVQGYRVDGKKVYHVTIEGEVKASRDSEKALYPFRHEERGVLEADLNFKAYFGLIKKALFGGAKDVLEK